MRVQRLLLLITDLEIGGTPTVVRELAIRLRGEAEIHVACLAEWGPVAYELQAAGVPVTALGAKHSGDFGIIRELVSLVDSQQIETIFSFLIHANALAAVVKFWRPNVRLIQSIQTTQPRPRWHWWLQRIVQRWAERIVVPSPSTARVAQLWAHVRANKIEVIPNAVEPPTNFERTRTPNGTTRIGFVGRLDPIKRVGDLVDAMKFLLPQYTLTVYGGGAEEAKLRGQIDRESLALRVRLAGPVASPWEALREIDLLVLPSDAEGFGLVLIEAMAAGVPVVATDVAGIRDVVRHARTGLLVPPRNPPALAVAIQQIMTDAAMRQRVVQAAAADVREQYMWSSVLPKYRALLIERIKRS